MRYSSEHETCKRSSTHSYITMRKKAIKCTVRAQTLHLPLPPAVEILSKHLCKRVNTSDPPLRHHHRAHAVNTLGAPSTRLPDTTAASSRAPPSSVRSVRSSIIQPHIPNILNGRYPIALASVGPFPYGPLCPSHKRQLFQQLTYLIP